MLLFLCEEWLTAVGRESSRSRQVFSAKFIMEEGNLVGMGHSSPKHQSGRHETPCILQLLNGFALRSLLLLLLGKRLRPDPKLTGESGKTH